MSEVEKYGLFALVFVAGVLGLAWVLDPAAETPAGAGAAERVVVMSRPSAASGAALNAAQPRTLLRPGQAESEPRRNAPRSPTRVRVPSLGEGLGDFKAGEPPVPYNGEHSVSVPIVDMNVPEFVVVKQGDTLSDLAQKHLGKASRHPEISALNPGVDERGLVPGQRLRLPRAGSRPATRNALASLASNGPAPAAKTAPGLYTVVSGDTLGEIAQRLKGSVSFKDDILKANRAIISNENQLAVGMTLRIP